MTAIRLHLEGPRARAEVTGPLTEGMRGIPVELEFDDSWEGLTRTLVCRGGAGVRIVRNVGTGAVVPSGAMIRSRHGENALFLGVEGRNPAGDLVMPSTMAYCGPILPGANPEQACPEEKDRCPGAASGEGLTAQEALDALMEEGMVDPVSDGRAIYTWEEQILVY